MPEGTWGPPGAEKGVCITCGQPARKPNAFYCEEHKPVSGSRGRSRGTSRGTSREQLTLDPKPQVVETSQHDGNGADPTPSQSLEEAPPQVSEPEEAIPAKPGIFQRIRSRSRRGGRTEQTPATGERTPRPPRGRPRKRLPLDADISDIWAFGGRRLEATPHYPTGRMLEYQAPAAGVIIDRAVAGTLPDRVIFQPLARNRDKYEDVAFLLAGPLLTFSITTTMGQMKAAADAGDQELYNDLGAKLTMQREMFTWCLAMMLPRLAAGAKLAAQKKAKRDAVISDAFPELGDEDPVEVLVTMLFQPPRFEEAAQNGKPDDRTTAAAGEQSTVQFGE